MEDKQDKLNKEECLVNCSRLQNKKCPLLKDIGKDTNTILDKLGGWLIFICIISIIIASVFYCCFDSKKQNISNIELSIAVDSTRVIDAVSMAKIDSLSYLLTKHNEDVKERYQYMIEQKEVESRLLTYGSVIISIILAIFGFFGYKSFKSIEEKAVSVAEEKANLKINTEMVTIRCSLDKELRGYIDQKFNDEYQTNFSEMVSKKLNESYHNEIVSKLEYITQHSKEFKGMQDTMAEILQFISKLQDQGVNIPIRPSTDKKSELQSLAEDRKSTKTKGGKS